MVSVLLAPIDGKWVTTGQPDAEPVRQEGKLKLSEVANKVINLAGKIREYYATELPKQHPNYPLVDPFEASMPRRPRRRC